MNSTEFLRAVHDEGYDTFVERVAALVNPRRCQHHKDYPGDDLCRGEPSDYCETIIDAAYRAGIIPRTRRAEMTPIEREMVRKSKMHTSRFVAFRAHDARAIASANNFDNVRVEAEIEIAEEHISVVIIDRYIATDTDAGIVWRAS